MMKEKKILEDEERLLFRTEAPESTIIKDKFSTIGKRVRKTA
jgi:hypothetical protein